MGGESAVLAGQIVDGLAQVLPAVGGALGGVAAKLLGRLGDKTTEEAGDAAFGWARQVVGRVFARRADGTSVHSDHPVPEDTIVDAEVAETLDELAENPECKSARRLLIRHVEAAAAANPALVEVLRELAEQMPGTTGTVGRSGDITQQRTSGINIAVSGTARDITVDDNAD